MIVGVTVSKEGEIIQRLPVTTKLAIGLAPSGEKRWPERLDHFILLKRGPDKGSWVLDADLMRHYAPHCKHDIAESCDKCCREIKILLLDDDIENVFPNELAWFGRTGKKCWGDGEKAQRRKDDVSDAAPWGGPCRNGGCPDWEAGKCAGSGDLRFCLADFPVLGSVSRIHTSSLRSIENISSALTNIQNFTGGRLFGVTVPLCVSMEPSTYIEDGKRKSTTVPILSIHAEVKALIASVKATMDLWGTARRAFGKSVLIDDDEESRAAEIPPEFPRKDAPRALPEATDVKPQPQTTKPDETPKEEKKAPEEPPVVKSKIQFEGTISAIRPAKKAGTNTEFWKVVLETPNPGERAEPKVLPVDLLVFSGSVKAALEDAMKRGAEVEVSGEARMKGDKGYNVAEHVALIARKTEPEPPADDDAPDWTLE